MLARKVWSRHRMMARSVSAIWCRGVLAKIGLVKKDIIAHAFVVGFLF